MAEAKLEVKVNNNEIIWDVEKGSFTFDGAPSLLFWDSAIELFFNTIEEVSGSDVSKTVYEATGYRMGYLVSSYYQGRSDIDQILNDYREIYKTAGWGNFTITYYSYDEKRVSLQLTNSWENRVFKNTTKQDMKVLLPSHWAGVFGGLFQQNMWYKIKNSGESEELIDIEVFASETTPDTNIHDLARQKEQQNIMKLEEKVKERTEELTQLVKELSSPIIPIFDGILVTPLIGKYNEERIRDLFENVLTQLSQSDYSSN